MKYLYVGRFELRLHLKHSLCAEKSVVVVVVFLCVFCVFVFIIIKQFIMSRSTYIRNSSSNHSMNRD